MRRMLGIAVVLLLVAAGAYWLVVAQRARPQGATMVVRRGAISATVETTGRVRSARMARLASQVTGIVEQIPVKPGDQVAAQAILLQLSNPALERAVRQAEIQLEIQEAALVQARSGSSDAAIAIATARLRQATVVLQTVQKAYDKIANQQDAATSSEAISLEAAKVSYEVAKSEFQRAVHGASSDETAQLSRQRDAARLNLEAARAQLENAHLRAPFAGTVLEISVQENEIANAGSQLVILADMSRLEIVAPIDEIDVAEIAVGQQVEVLLDAFPEKRLSGQVTHLDPAAAPQRGSTVYEATIVLNQSEPGLRPDLGANLQITTLKREGVLLVPNRAIQRVGQRKIVRLVEGRRVREVEVTLGLANREETEVVRGLEEGQVCLVE